MFPHVLHLRQVPFRTSVPGSAVGARVALVALELGFARLFGPGGLGIVTRSASFAAADCIAVACVEYPFPLP